MPDDRPSDSGTDANSAWAPVLTAELLEECTAVQTWFSEPAGWLFELPDGRLFELPDGRLFDTPDGRLFERPDGPGFGSATSTDGFRDLFFDRVFPEGPEAMVGDDVGCRARLSRFFSCFTYSFEVAGCKGSTGKQKLDEKWLNQ